MYELRCHLRPVGQRLVAHQMEGVAAQVMSFGNVYECAILHLVARGQCLASQPPQHQLVGAVGNGTYGRGRRDHHVLHHTDIEVGIGTHHRCGGAGADVFAEAHRVGICLLARAAKDDVEIKDRVIFGRRQETIFCCAGHYARIAVHISSNVERKVQTGLEGHVHCVAVLQFGALRQCGRTATAWRVAQNVNQHGLVGAEHILAACRREHVEQIAAQRRSLVGGAVLTEGHGHGAQGILACQQAGGLLGTQHVVALSLFVERHRLLGDTVLEAVVDGDGATAYSHDVLLLTAGCVVIRIVLGHGNLYGVASLQAEYGVAEGVESPPSPCGGRQWHLRLVASQVGGEIALVAEVVERVVAYLPVGDLHGSVVDAVVAVVVDFCGLIDAASVHIGERAFVPDGVRCETVGQVDDLAHLSLLEQRGVAVAVDLAHLPAHGRQLQHILARRGVGLHLHALALHGGHGLVALAGRMLVGVHALLLRGVQVVVDQPRRVVALQCEHHRQVVAQVVVREVIIQRQAALVVATHNAARNLHLLGIVEVNLCHVVVDYGPLGALVVAVEFEGVPVHDGLDGVCAGQDVERELTIEAALQGRATRHHLVPVQQELCAVDGDAGAREHDVARELVAARDAEVLQTLVVAGGVESHLILVNLVVGVLCTVVQRSHSVRHARAAEVRQIVGLEVTRVIRLYTDGGSLPF